MFHTTKLGIKHRKQQKTVNTFRNQTNRISQCIALGNETRLSGKLHAFHVENYTHVSQYTAENYKRFSGELKTFQ